MIDIGFNLVTIASEQRFMTNGAKEAVSKLKKIEKKSDSSHINFKNEKSTNYSKNS